MRALVAAPQAPGGIELRDVADPDPGPDEALVEQRAFSLNRGECAAMLMAGEGWRPGWDVAGVVLRPAADGGSPGEGTRVVGWANGGAWAERVAVGRTRLAALPDGVPYEVASTLPVAGLTALGALRLGGPVAGARVAVVGATGGVGRFAIQMARSEGAHVTAIVTGPERAAGLRDLGAQEIEVGLRPDGAPFDLILESVGGPSLAAALARVTPDGTVVTFGNSSGGMTEFDARTFYRRGRPAMRGFFVTHELLEGRIGTTQLEELVEMVRGGRLHAQIGLLAGWEDAARAVEELLARRVAGKAVLTLG